MNYTDIIPTNKICVIILTRNRFLDFNLFASTWEKTTEGKSVVIVGVDEDDNSYDGLIENNTFPFIWERLKPGPFLPNFNKLALKYAMKYKYISYLADDLIFKTRWESLIIDKLDSLGKNGIVWVWDGHNPITKDEKLPHNCGIPFFNYSIITRLGYMCPLKLLAGAADNYWSNLVMRMKETSYFFEDIEIEHRHFSYGLRNKDSTSLKIQSESAPDWKYFESDQFYIDVENDVKKLTL